MMSIRKQTTILIILSTIIKLLLLPSYHSTDFDVHRNWMAITKTLPISQWYFDDMDGQTVHTLDYPPLFAFFEMLISRNYITNWFIDRGVVDERCLTRLSDDHNGVSDACLWFQRCTVILFDVVLLFGAIFATKSVILNMYNVKKKKQQHSDDGVEKRVLITIALIVLNPGLLLLDHVHFQYNGMLLGILLCSVGCIVYGSSSDGNNGVYYLLGAVCYGILLTMKHLYLPLAPLYFVYLLRHYCFVVSADDNTTTLTSSSFSIKRFMNVACVTIFTIITPFVPFLMQTNPKEQMIQMIRRLLPFARGLCHDYWAANVWALYMFATKCVTFANRTFFSSDIFSLPVITPAITACLLFLSLLPAMLCAWKVRLSSSSNLTSSCTFFIHAVVYCSFCGFMLAYHMHEKAIMTAIVPLTLLSTISQQNARLYFRTCALGHFALFPLLYQPAELSFKVFSYVSHLILTILLLDTVSFVDVDDGRRIEQDGNNTGRLGAANNDNKHNQESSSSLLTVIDKIGLSVLFALFVFVEVIHPLWLHDNERLEFLPLMATSVICAIGLIGCWISSGYLMVRSCTRSNGVTVDRVDDKKKGEGKKSR